MECTGLILQDFEGAKIVKKMEVCAVCIVSTVALILISDQIVISKKTSNSCIRGEGCNWTREFPSIMLNVPEHSKRDGPV